MAFKKPTIKNTKTSLPDKFTNKTASPYNEKFNEKNSEDELRALYAEQHSINDYNTATYNYMNNKDPFFDTLTLVNDKVIVKLFKENIIKSWIVRAFKDENGEEQRVNVPAETGYAQIDGRQYSNQQETYVDTPLPYIMKGMVVAISDYSKNELAKQNITLNVGDIVHIDDIIIKDRRYYTDKQIAKLDYVRNQVTHNLSNHKGYFLLSYMDIEAIEVEQEINEENGNESN